METKQLLFTMEKSSRRKFIAKASLASIGALSGIQSVIAAIPAGSESLKSTKSIKASPRSKRDLMMQVLDMSSKPNYIPAGFFMHFGVTGDAAIKAHVDYFRATGMDFLKIQFDELSLPKNNQISSPKDWAKMPVLPETWFEPALYLLRNLIKEVKSEALVIQTLYSPYQLAKQAVPWNLIVEHVKQDAESVCRGMENITLSILNFINAAARAGVDGFYMCSQGGETNRIADLPHFYRVIKNFDMIIFKEAGQLVPFNIMHLCDYDGSYADFASHFQDYPGQVINVPLSADNKPLSLLQAAEIFKRPVMGGLDRHGVISTGTSEDVRKATIEVLKNAPANMILGADCTVDRKTPVENLKAAIDTAHRFRT
jgi:uroporphyrinogen decarboxylase